MEQKGSPDGTPRQTLGDFWLWRLLGVVRSQTVPLALLPRQRPATPLFPEQAPEGYGCLCCFGEINVKSCGVTCCFPPRLAPPVQFGCLSLAGSLVVTAQAQDRHRSTPWTVQQLNRVATDLTPDSSFLTRPTAFHLKCK